MLGGRWILRGLERLVGAIDHSNQDVVQAGEIKITGLKKGPVDKFHFYISRPSVLTVLVSLFHKTRSSHYMVVKTCLN